MENHIKVARALRALSWFYAVIGALVLTALVAPGGKPASAVSFLILLPFVAFFALHHFTARGARRKHPAARIVSMIIACLMLFAFPLGTIVGIYVLVNASSSWEPPVADAARA
jgi:hypothetical protein